MDKSRATIRGSCAEDVERRVILLKTAMGIPNEEKHKAVTSTTLYAAKNVRHSRRQMNRFPTAAFSKCGDNKTDVAIFIGVFEYQIEAQNGNMDLRKPRTQSQQQSSQAEKMNLKDLWYAA